MTTLDIRQNFAQVTAAIQFDDSSDRLVFSNKLTFSANGNMFVLCDYNDLDNFILACQKAKA